MRTFLIAVSFVAVVSGQRSSEIPLRDGDVIFQESRSAQSRAIRVATKSQYTHMGILFSRDGRWYVYEAVGPVKVHATLIRGSKEAAEAISS